MATLKGNLEIFEKAFDGHRGSSCRACHCGKQFYNSDGGWDFEPGQLEELEQSGAIDLPWSVGSVVIDGVEYVPDCECWHPRAKNVMTFLEKNAWSIAEYLTLVKKRLQDEAARFPTVD